jgi:hypothetical protein
MTGLSGLILQPEAAVGKPEPSSWGLPGTKVGDGSAFCARNVDFAFVWTCLATFDVGLGLAAASSLGTSNTAIVSQGLNSKSA